MKEIRIISRGDENETGDGHLVEHTEKVYVEFPPSLPAGASGPEGHEANKRDVLILRDTKDCYGVYDIGTAWWFEEAYGVEEVLAAYLKEIISWGQP